MKRLLGALGACLTLLAALLLTSGPASADITCDTTGACTSTETIQVLDDACVQMQQLHTQYGVDIPDGMCNGSLENVTQTIQVDAPLAISMGRGSPTAYCKTWSQWLNSTVGLWKEKHKGQFCYTKSGSASSWDAWAPPATKYSQYTYHTCGLSKGAGFSVTVIHCKGNRQPANTSAGYMYQQWDDFKVSFLYNGFPITASHEMHANVFPGGSIKFHIDN